MLRGIKNESIPFPVNRTNQMKDQITNCIANLQENIARIESTIRSNFWQKGYVANCKAAIASHKEQISKLQIQLSTI